MSLKKRITIRDVARRAGVAPITASRAINRSGYVTGKVRKRVEAAAAKLDYVPNAIARSLRSRRTHTIALILTDITNPFFTTVARGVEDAANDAGYMVIVCNTDENEAKERKYVRMLLQNRVDGILLVPASGAGGSIRLIQKQAIPVVMLDRRATGVSCDAVRCDSDGGAYWLGRLLASLGHRRIALLAGPEGVSTSDDRIAGCCRALSDAGITADYGVYRGEFTQESGYEMTRRALSAEPRPSALFAVNNFLAMGALRALRDGGIRVPEDAALVGFDDLPPALVPQPFLTVVAQPAYEMGRKSVELLLDRLNERRIKSFQEIVLPAQLIIRRSSGNPIAS